MWAKVESNTVTEIYTRPVALNIGGTQYPSNIFQLWEAAELRAIGIHPVEEDSSNLKNSKYYVNGNPTVTYSSGKVTRSYPTATAKPLADLKAEEKRVVNGTANSYLAETDWMVIREADAGTAMPSNIKTYRAAVRTKANTHCTNIDDAADVDALAALTFDWPAHP